MRRVVSIAVAVAAVLLAAVPRSAAAQDPITKPTITTDGRLPRPTGVTAKQQSDAGDRGDGDVSGCRMADRGHAYCHALTPAEAVAQRRLLHPCALSAVWEDARNEVGDGRVITASISAHAELKSRISIWKHGTEHARLTATSTPWL